MPSRTKVPVFDETPEEVESAIIRGLRYLEQEAHGVRLTGLAEVIAGAIDRYVTGAHTPARDGLRQRSATEWPDGARGETSSNDEDEPTRHRAGK